MENEEHPTGSIFDDPRYEPGYITAWWSKKRRYYNKGLVLSGIGAFILYATVIVMKSFNEISDRNLDGHELTIFTIFFQGIGYLFTMGIANIFYFLGPAVDEKFNTNNSEKFRERLFNLGYNFSCFLPFLIPILAFIRL